MASFDEELVKIALELIGETGRQVSFQFYDNSAADSTLPWKGQTDTPAVTSQFQTMATFVSASGIGTNLVSEDMLSRVNDICLVAQTEVDIRNATKILDGGVLYGIEWCQVLKPGTEVMLYVFGMKR